MANQHTNSGKNHQIHGTSHVIIQVVENFHARDPIICHYAEEQRTGEEQQARNEDVTILCPPLHRRGQITFSLRVEVKNEYEWDANTESSQHEYAGYFPEDK